MIEKLFESLDKSRYTHVAGLYKGGMVARTMDILKLLSQPESMRDQSWEAAFLAGFSESAVLIEEPEPQRGPDGWPYLMVRTDPQATEPVVKIVDWLSTRGIGMVLNVHKQIPDYVFTYGMTWNFVETGMFLSPTDPVEMGKVVFDAGQKVHIGEPTEQYLPPYVRTILKEFLADQGIKQPRITMVSKDLKHYDLAFSLNSLGSPPSHEHKGIAEALSWFLPQHYSILLAQENELPQYFDL